MKRYSLLLSLMLMVFGAFAVAQEGASVYVIHGIPGESVGIDGAPVDVYVNGGLVLSSFMFRDIAGPLNLPAGSYDIAVYLAGSDPEFDAPVMTLPGAELTDGLNLTIIANLTADGGFVLTPFVNNIMPIYRSFTYSFYWNNPDLSRFVVRHTAQAPTADLLVNNSPAFTVSNGTAASADVRARKYRFAIAATGSFVPVLGPVDLELEDDKAYFAYAVGSLADGTFDLILHTIDLLD
ncbi:MAG: DUF4397 domain-containing protein [Acidobacteria bacterium]|nr:DUF4397 domain-containing protein [Acidobacteriota bacterium]